MQEDKKMIMKIKREIFTKKLDTEDKLFTGEYVGDFVLRYITYQLYLRDIKLKKRQAKKNESKLVVLDESDTHQSTIH